MTPKECKLKREELGLSRNVLAKEIGYSPGAVSLYENKNRGGSKLKKSLEEFFSDPNINRLSNSDGDVKYFRPTKEEANRFKVDDEIIRIDDGVSVGILKEISKNYLKVTPHDPMASEQLYHPAYFKVKKSK